MKIIEQEYLLNLVNNLDSELNKMALDHSYNIELLHNQIFGYSIKVYILLTFMLSRIKLNDDYSPEDIFYNRYLWFYRFSKLKEKQEGYDPGINQQLIKLLEEIDHDNLNISWQLIQKISDELDEEVK